MKPRTRLAAGAVALASVTTAAVLGLRIVGSDAPAPTSSPEALRTAEERPEGLPEGWTELPLPPEVRGGAALVWAGNRLLAWGGCDPAVEDECTHTADGFAFDPATRTWETLPPAPLAAGHAHAMWTGQEAIFLRLDDQPRLDGVAYEPATGAWRRVPSAPIAPRYARVQVWTGTELIVWGGGGRRHPGVSKGAAYDPATDDWRRITDGPLGLNLASGVWTGREVIAFGSLLDRRNWAETATSVGAAYDPVTDTWRKIPPSALSPQATSAAWLGGRMVAGDYGLQSQEYEPVQDTWSAPLVMPLEAGECYPDSVVVGALVFAYYCGQVALYDVAIGVWQEVHGGPVEETIEIYDRPYKLWRFASLASADDVVFLGLEVLTVTRRGIPCYGCPGFPVSFWAYRPPPRLAPKPPVQDRATADDALRVASDFMDARVLRPKRASIGS